jgi:hypothetical protein
MIEEWDNFYAMIRPAAKVKRVECLKCKRVFKGTAGNRLCSACKKPHIRKNYYVSP